MRNLLLRAVLAAALLLASLATAVPAMAQDPPTEPFECPTGALGQLLGALPGEDLVLPERVSCAHVTVPLDRSQPDGSAIRVATARITPPGETDAPPLVVLMGGPGQSAIELLPLFVLPTPHSVLAAEREVVLLDQRGVGSSQPSLECPQAPEVAPSADPDEQLAITIQALAACHQALTEEGHELGAYNTAENAADVADVVAALGYDAVDLYGVSYGSTLALQVAAAQPDWLRTLTLDSAIDPTANFLTDAATSFDRALDVTDEACAAVPGCAEDEEPLSAVLAAALDDLAQEPLTITVPLGEEETLDIPLNAYTAANLVFATYYDPSLLQELPTLVRALAQRDTEGIVQLLAPLLQQQPTAGAALGMQLSVLCAEEIAATSPEAVQEAAADTRQLIREHWLPYQPIAGLPAFEICAQWDVPAQERFDPVQTDVPALVATGTFDQITPPRYGEAVADRIDDATVVRFTDMGHAPLLNSGPCGMSILIQFLADPDGELTTGCVDDPSPFAPSPIARIAGADRVATAVAASQDLWEDDGAEGAVVATAGAFPDALAGTPLAVAEDGPLLLTGAEELDTRVAEELQRVLPEDGSVTLLGGSAALSAEVETAVADLGLDVRRIGGEDRYATAVAVAEDLGAAGEVILATGADFADALVAAPLAAAEGRALLLTAGDELPAATAGYLDDVDVAEALAVGGPAATAVPAAQPIVGPDRYATAATVAREFFPEASVAGVASGEAFPDAASGGAHIAALGGPLLLTPSMQAPLHTVFTVGSAPALEQLYVYGGPAAVAELVTQALDRAL